MVRLVDEWASFLPAATFDSFRADLGLTYRGAALALLAIGPGAIVGSAITALGDRRSRRVLAGCGAVVYAAALGLFAIAHTLWMLVAGGCGVGLGATLLVDTVEVALADLCADGPALERALAWTNVMAGVGDLAGPVLVAGAAAVGWSWRIPLAVTAVAVAVYGVLIAVTPLPAPARDDPVTADAAAPREIALLRRADIRWAGACGAVLVALDESFVAFVIAYLRRDAGVSTAVATTVAAVFVVGGLVAATAIARRGPSATPVQHLGRRLRTPATAMFVGAVALAAWPQPVVAAASGFVLGAATIAFWIPFQAATLQLVPGRTAAVTAVVGAIEMAGLGAAPLIGAVSDAHGLRFGLVAYCVLPAVLAALSVRAPAGRLAPTAVERPE